MSQIRVAVADAQRMFAEALASALSEEPGLDLVGACAQSADDLLRVVQTEQPDVVLVDYYLDVTIPEELLPALTARAAHAKTLFLSWLHAPELIERVLAAGAVGYLPKNCELDLVAEAVRRAQAGERPVFGHKLKGLLTGLEQRGATAQQVEARIEQLTYRELEVLAWVATGASREQVAEQLGVSPDTVRTHLMNVKAKTGARTQLEAVRLAEGKAAAWLPDGLPR